MNELQNPGRQDPFHGSSRLSLLSRTVRFSIKGVASEQQELETSENILRSMSLKNSKELLKHADTVMKSQLELPNYEITCDLALKNEGKSAVADGAGPYQRRRPGLGRKRAQFSFQSSTSQSFSNVGPTLSTGQLQDPVEFFLAYDKLEIAEKELKRLRGETSIDQIQRHQSTTERRRRPGILGKTVTYKHYCPAPADNVLTFVSSQEEKNEVNIPSLSKGIPNLGFNSSMLAEATDQHGTLRGMETAASELATVTQGKGSISELESRISNLLNVMLSTRNDLDAGEMNTLLKEHLHIKPSNLGKLCFPDLDGVHGTNNYKTSQEKLSRPRKLVSDLQQMIKTSINGKTSVKNQQNLGSSRCPQMSSTPPKSPFALMPILQRHISQMGSLRDPFSFSPIVDAPFSQRFFPDRSVDRRAISSPLCTDRVDTQNLSANGDPTPGKIDGKRLSFDGKLQCTQLEEDNTVVSNTGSGKLPAENSSSPIDRPVDDSLSKFLSDMDVMSDGPDGNLQNKEDMPQEVSVSQGPALGLGSLSTETRDFSGNQLDQSGPVEEQVPIDGHSENSGILQKQSNEELKGPSRKASSKLRKQKVPPCRQSLAGAGTLWKSGVRRSTRIKSRPLEYWRGERFLYGRIHDSLATVIGVKYASPSKSGEDSVLKVKSYVPDKYTELVEKAALY